MDRLAIGIVRLSLGPIALTGPNEETFTMVVLSGACSLGPPSPLEFEDCYHKKTNFQRFCTKNFEKRIAQWDYWYRREENLLQMTNFNIDAALRGTEISKEAAELKEELLELFPGDVEARSELIGHYYMHYFCCSNARFARVPHIIWMIDHTDDLSKLEASFIYTHLVDRDAFRTIRSAYEQRLHRQSDNCSVIVSMARFIKSHDPEQAETLLRRALTLKDHDRKILKQLRILEVHKPMLFSNRNQFLKEAVEDYFKWGLSCSGS